MYAPMCVCFFSRFPEECACLNFLSTPVTCPCIFPSTPPFCYFKCNLYPFFVRLYSAGLEPPNLETLYTSTQLSL
jgi:hypothetical protein